MRRLGFVTVVAWLAVVSPAWAVDATCGELQDKLDDPSISTVTLQADDGLCEGVFLADRELTLEGEPGAGFQPGSEQSGVSLDWTGGAGTLTLRNLIFLGPADGNPNAGGARMSVEGDVVVEGNTFKDIRWTESGWPQGALTTVSVNATLTDNVFGGPGAGNSSAHSGGAVNVHADDFAWLDGNTFTENFSGSSGGGARIDAFAAAIVDNTFTGNEAFGFGGGLALSTADDSDELGARARPGDDDPEFDADLLRNRFEGNHAGAAGGGLMVGKRDDSDYDQFGQVTIRAQGNFTGGSSPEVRLERNVYDLNQAGGVFFAASGGGAQFFGVNAASSAERYIRNGLVGPEEQPAPTARQNPGGEGGGVAVSGTSNFESGANREASFAAKNLVVAGNEVADGGEGAGIYIGEGGCSEQNGQVEAQASPCSTFLRLIHATVAGNVINGAGEDAGIAADPSDDIDIDNSIIYGNEDTDGESTPDEIGGTESIVVEHSDVCQNGQPWPSAENPPNICADPKLVGPTKAQGADVHQTAASPTLDRDGALEGDEAVTDDYEDDQRPILVSGRSATPYDMGADEYEHADFGVTITDGPDPVQEGGVLTYTVTADNAGPVAATGLVLTVTLPFAAASVPDGCSQTTTITCSIGSLAAGASRELKFVVSPNKAGSVEAKASIAGTIDDPTVDDHNAATTTLVTAKPPGGGNAILPDNTGAKACASRRSFKIKLRRAPRGDRFVAATIRVNGKKVKVLKGRRLSATVNLRGLPRGRFTVTIVARTKKGKTVRGKRVYRTCTPKRSGGKIPPI